MAVDFERRNGLTLDQLKAMTPKELDAIVEAIQNRVTKTYQQNLTHSRNPRGEGKFEPGSSAARTSAAKLSRMLHKL